MGDEQHEPESMFPEESDRACACGWRLPAFAYATTESEPITISHSIVMQCPHCGEVLTLTIHFGA